MNILITGANGLVGRNLVNILSKSNNIYAIVRVKNSLNFSKNDNIEVIEMDLSDIKLFRIPNDVDAIFYLAQSKKFRDFPNSSEDIIKINLIKPHLLAKWSIDRNVRVFVYLSSGGIIKKPNQNIEEFFKTKNSSNISFYLSTKLCSELILKNYANFFETFSLVRPFFIYGPGQDPSMLIPRLISNIKQEKEIYLDGKNGTVINPIYVTDAANAIANILKLKGKFLIDIAGNEVISIKQLSIIIGNILNKKPIFSYTNKKPSKIIGDNRFMIKKLWKPQVNIQEGISNLILNTLEILS